MIDYRGHPLQKELYKGNVDIHLGMFVTVVGHLVQFDERENEIRKTTGRIDWIGQTTFVVEDKQGDRTQLSHTQPFTVITLHGTNEDLSRVLFKADEDM